jgi:hypothetical protein
MAPERTAPLPQPSTILLQVDHKHSYKIRQKDTLNVVRVWEEREALL